MKLKKLTNPFWKNYRGLSALFLFVTVLSPLPFSRAETPKDCLPSFAKSLFPKAQNTGYLKEEILALEEQAKIWLRLSDEIASVDSLKTMLGKSKDSPVSFRELLIATEKARNRLANEVLNFIKTCKTIHQLDCPDALLHSLISLESKARFEIDLTTGKHITREFWENELQEHFNLSLHDLFDPTKKEHSTFFYSTIHSGLAGEIGEVYASARFPGEQHGRKFFILKPKKNSDRHSEMLAQELLKWETKVKEKVTLYWKDGRCLETPCFGANTKLFEKFKTKRNKQTNELEILSDEEAKLNLVKYLEDKEMDNVVREGSQWQWINVKNKRLLTGQSFHDADQILLERQIVDFFQLGVELKFYNLKGATPEVQEKIRSLNVEFTPPFN